MLRNLTGRRVLITGASSGIGKALALQAAQRGMKLLLAARSEEPLQELAQTLTSQGATVLAIPADVTSTEDRQRLLYTATSQFGGLDILINNAGIASFGHFATSSEEINRQIMEVNFFAPAELIRLFVPVLTQGQQPAIVNIASMCGRRGLPAWSEYSASKFALCGLTEALRGEMARFDIDVLLMVPGLTSTGFPAHMLRNEGRLRLSFDTGMSPEFVAGRILRSLEQNKIETVLGREAQWILRVNRFLPRLVDRLMARKVRRLYASKS